MATERKAGVSRPAKFTTLFDHVWQDPRLTKHGVLVYLALCSFANKERTCFPGFRTIARVAKLSMSSTQSGVRELQAAGFIKRRVGRKPGGRQWGPTVYEIFEHGKGGVLRQAKQGASSSEAGGASPGKGGGASPGSTELEPEETMATPEDVGALRGTLLRAVAGKRMTNAV